MKKTTNLFFDEVYQVVRLIPKGRVSTYGAIAKYISTGKAARMVGWAMNKAGTVVPQVPAHRVVNRLGLLTGKHHFEGGPDAMQHLLEKEGHRIIEDQIQQFDKVFWDPMIELDIEK